MSNSWLAFALCMSACTVSTPPPAPPVIAPEPTPVFTANGEVLGVDETPPSGKLATSMRVVIQTSGGEHVQVELAPGWYLSEKGFAISPKDKLLVEGTRGSNGVVQARKVQSGSGQVELRNQEGAPLWTEPVTPQH